MVVVHYTIIPWQRYTAHQVQETYFAIFVPVLLTSYILGLKILKNVSVCFYEHGSIFDMLKILGKCTSRHLSSCKEL